MSDSDAEFEKFLQESFSSTTTSNQSRRSNANSGPGGPLHSKLSNEGARSDQELEATGNSWLKSSANPLRNLQVTLPSIGEKLDGHSKDSLEPIDIEEYLKDLRDMSSSRDSSREAASPTKPGLDTLEENADKSRFFAELEDGKSSPVDYADLNKNLTDTAKSSIGTSEIEEEYKDDFESMSGTHQEPSSSSLSLSSKSAGNLELGTEEQHGFTLSPIHVSETQVTESASKGGLSVPLDGAKVREKGERRFSHNTVTTGLSDDNMLLLKKRASRPSLLFAEDVPLVGTTLQNLLSSSSESTNSQHFSTNNLEHPDRKLAPLAPLASELISTSESGAAKRVEESVSSVRSKDSHILKPLETEKPASEAIVARRASEKPDSQGTAVLTSVSTERPMLESKISKTETVLGKKASFHSDLQNTGGPTLISVSTKEPALETEMPATYASLSRKDSLKDKTDLLDASVTSSSTEKPTERPPRAEAGYGRPALEPERPARAEAGLLRNERPALETGSEVRNASDQQDVGAPTSTSTSTAPETERPAKTEPALLSQANVHPAKSDTGTPALTLVDTGRPTSTGNHSGSLLAETAQLATLYQPSEHARKSTTGPRMKATEDALTAVTDAPNSTVSDFISQLAELQSSSLVMNEPPPVTSSQQKSQQSHFQSSSQAIGPSVVRDEEDDFSFVTKTHQLESRLGRSTDPSLIVNKPHLVTSTQQGSRLQSQLQGSTQLLDEPAHVTSTQQNSLLLSQLKDSAHRQAFGGDDHPHHFTPIHESALSDELYQPASGSDAEYGEFDVQNIIRAIACEEIASAGRDILETKRKQPQPLPSVSQGAGKAYTAKLKPPKKGVGHLKVDAPVSRQKKEVVFADQEQVRTGTLSKGKKGPGISKKGIGAQTREQKGVGVMNKEKKGTATRKKAWQESVPHGQGSVNKKKPGLHSSRESLASKSDSSIQKVHKKATNTTRSQLGSRDREDNFSHPRQLTSKFSQKSSKKGSGVHKTSPARPTPKLKLSPKAVHRTYLPTVESPISSSSSSSGLEVDYNIHSSEVKGYPEHTAAVAFRSELATSQLAMEFTQKEDEMRKKHEREISDLKQELFSLSVKLKEFEVAQNARKCLASGKAANISHEEKVALQKEIKEQEVLLQGYQKENERLCAELSSMQLECKSSVTRLYQENQSLSTELINTKEELKALSQRHQYPPPPMVTSPREDPAAVAERERAAAELARLEHLLEKEHDEKKTLENQVKQLKHASQCLEQEVRDLKRRGKELESAVQERVSGELLENLKKKHAEEVAELKERLKAYSDKQKVTDSAMELLKSKEVEILGMKERLESLEAEKGKTSSSSQARKSRGGSESRRIRELEKHVKELEKVIQKRFPNSLSALILAANNSSELEVESRKQTAEACVKELEGYVQEMRDLMEAAERESTIKYSLLQHQYQDLQTQYEKQAQSLSTAQQWIQVEGPTQVVEMSPNDLATPTSPSSKSLLMENKQLKDKLSGVNFELAHQKVQLQGQLAEAERRVSLVQEEAQRKVAKLKEEHQDHVDALVAKFAVDQSQLEITRLLSQLKAKEATIQHLREEVDCMKFDTQQLADCKAREKKLEEQLKATSEELLEARKTHTPEMHHFMLLRGKIASLEERNRDFEAKNKLLWHNLMQTGTETSVKEIEHKWRCQVLAKNAEIEQYREELDSLMAALRVLQQGRTPTATTRPQTNTTPNP